MAVAANKRGWGWPGAPGSAEDRKYRRDHLTQIAAGGVKLLVRKEVAPLFKWFIEELTGPAYKYALNGRADDWGYANRDVRGRPGVKSNHAWGLAVDLNATTNPMTNDGRTHTDLPPGISKLAAKYGLRWGGDYSGRKDPMHFEFIGTPEDAQEYVRHLSKHRDTPAGSAQPKTQGPPPAPIKVQTKGKNMAVLITEDNKAVYGFDGVRCWWIPNPEIGNAVKATGIYGDGKVYEVPKGTINALVRAEKL